MYTNVFDVISAMRESNGTNEKIAIMESIKSDETLERDFIRIAIATYSPYINFYIKSYNTPEPTLGQSGPRSITSTHSLGVLESIARREVTGNAAKTLLETLATELTPKSQQVLEMIINRSFGSGISGTSINKVWPNTIPKFNVMLCQPLNDKTLTKIKFPAYAQLKYDAARITIIVNNGIVKYFTRNGKEYLIENSDLDTQFQSMVETVPNKAGVFDGELFSNNGDRLASNGVATKFVRGTASKEDHNNVNIVLWDFIHMDEFTAGKGKFMCSDRFEILKSLNRYKDINYPYNNGMITIADNIIVYSIEEALEINDMHIKNGEEGSIIKNMDGQWEAKRSNDTIKLKEVLESELRVVASVYGINKYANLCGALECESEDGLVKVSVGTGLSDEMRREFAPEHAFETIVGQIITVKHNGLITSKSNTHASLYLPRFVEIRYDKDEADTITKIKNESSRG
jgi:ATP-dependent DNA ligase